MTFKQRRYECASCGEAVKAFAWNTDAPQEHCGTPMHETDVTGDRAPAVIDDQLEGGPRHFETMGDDAPFIESKSQWRREVAKRELIPKGDRKPSDYFARQRRRHDEELRDTGRNTEY